jgi:hypothetical protein
MSWISHQKVTSRIERELAGKAVELTLAKEATQEVEIAAVGRRMVDNVASTAR